MFGIVALGSDHEGALITRVLEGGKDFLVVEKPISRVDVLIVASVLQEDA